MSVELTKEYLQEQPIEQQVQLVNNWLKDMSLSAIGKMLKTDESTIRKRFNYNGYERKGKKFVRVKQIETRNNQIKKVKEESKKSNNLETRVMNLERAVKALQIANYHNCHNHHILPSKIKELSIYRSAESPISRNHRFYPEVLEKLKQVKGLYPEYTIQDVINSLLMDAISRYIK